MRALLVLVLVAGSFAVAVPGAEAAVFNVDTTADGNDGECAIDCTVREAIDLAEDSNGTDTINLLANQTHAVSAGFTGGLVITTSDEIRIQGPGLIQGGPGLNDPLIEVVTTGNLKLVDLALTGGNMPDTTSLTDNGAGIHNSGTVSLEDVTVSGNTADDAGGGAFNSSTGTLNVLRGAFTSNDATNLGGGAIANDGSLTVDGTTFSVNTSGQLGGAVFSNTINTTTIRNSTFTGNDDDGTGGAVSNGDGPLNISRSLFDDNSALGTNPASGEGGAINHTGASTFVLSDSTVSNNDAFARGGGIFAGGPTTIRRSTISKNVVGGTSDGSADGGGVSNVANGFSITNSTVSGNRAEDFGGGIRSDGSGTITNTTITKNIANDPNAANDNIGFGGGLLAGGTVTLTGSIVFGNVQGPTTGFPADDCGGDVQTDGGNVLGANSQCPVGQDPTDTIDSPELGRLKFNGGPTKTHLIGPASSALDRNDDDVACGGTDQRGAPRPTDEDCDAGGYERVSCDTVLVNIVGTGQSDDLTGTSGNDGILALSGNDTINGGLGNDRICAGGGIDDVKGGAGNDKLFGQAGSDTLNGGPDTDVCVGGAGPEVFRGCETEVA